MIDGLNRLRRPGLLVATCLLAGCGGGGGNSGAEPPIVGVPTPAPSPTPSPTPSPSPSAVAFRAVATDSGLIGEAIFDITADGIFGNSKVSGSDFSVATNRSGDFGRDATGRLNSFSTAPATADSAIQFFGVDAATGFAVNDLRVAAGVTVISPVTALLRFLDDDVVAANTGLGATARQLAAFDYSRSLSSQDADRRALATRVLALNLKLLAYGGLGSSASFVPEGTYQMYDGLSPVVERYAKGALGLDDPAQVAQVLERSSAALRGSPAARAAGAQLLARFGQAVDRYLAQGGTPTRIQYGLQFRVLPELYSLFRGNSNDGVSASAITVADLIADFESYVGLDALDINTPGLLAVADYRRFLRFEAGDALTLQGCGTPERSLPSCNDFSLSNRIDKLDATVEYVGLPAQFAGSASVTLASDGSIVLRRLTTRQQMIWFDYTARDANGRSGGSRVYVALNGDL